MQNIVLPSLIKSQYKNRVACAKYPFFMCLGIFYCNLFTYFFSCFLFLFFRALLFNHQFQNWPLMFLLSLAFPSPVLLFVVRLSLLNFQNIEFSGVTRSLCCTFYLNLKFKVMLLVPDRLSPPCSKLAVQGKIFFREISVGVFSKGMCFFVRLHCPYVFLPTVYFSGHGFPSLNKNTALPFSIPYVEANL